MDLQLKNHLIFLIFVMINNFVHGEKCATEHEIIQKLLSVENDRDVPASDDGNLIVDVSLRLDGINIVTHTNQIQLNGELVQRWKDPSLYFSHLVPCDSYLNMGKHLNSVWQPEHMESNIDGTINLLPSATMHVNQNGSVQLSQRMRQNVPCKTDALSYPFGETTCTLILRNKAWSRDAYLVRWDNSNQEKTSIKEVGDLVLVDTNFDSAELFEQNGVFDELSITFNFKRGHKKVLLLFFLPSVLFMLISWFSLTLGPMAITRAILCVSSLVLLQIHYSNNLAGLPETSGITSIDIWKLFSLLYVVLVLLQMVFVTCMVSVGRSSVWTPCCKKSGRKGKYFVEPLYEELNDLRARKTRRTSGCCRYFAIFTDFVAIWIFAAILVVFSIFFYYKRSLMVQYLIDVDLQNLITV